MKKLYRVNVEFDFYVVADDDGDAFLTAKDVARDAFNDTWDPYMSVDEEKSIDRVPEDWRQSYPYGEDETERTCEQILQSANTSTGDSNG